MLNLAFGDGASDGEIVNAIKMLKPAYKNGELFKVETKSSHKDDMEIIKMVQYWRNKYEAIDKDYSRLISDWQDEKIKRQKYERKVNDIQKVLDYKVEELNSAQSLYEREISKLKDELKYKVDTWFLLLSFLGGMFIVSILK